MAKRDSVDEVLDIIKAIIVAIVGFIIIRVLLTLV